MFFTGIYSRKMVIKITTILSAPRCQSQLHALNNKNLIKPKNAIERARHYLQKRCIAYRTFIPALSGKSLPSERLRGHLQ